MEAWEAIVVTVGRVPWVPMVATEVPMVLNVSYR